MDVGCYSVHGDEFKGGLKLVWWCLWWQMEVQGVKAF